MTFPKPCAPTFEQYASGLGMETASPRLSWQFVQDDNTVHDWEQKGYEVEIENTSSHEKASYSVTSNNSNLVPWPAPPLRSREGVRVRVRAYGVGFDEPTDWSTWAGAECGLQSRDGWTACFIGSQTCFDGSDAIRPLRFRRAFSVSSGTGESLRARLYITALGVYTAYVNGERVSDDCMNPGWTSYKHHLAYQTYDVSSLLKPKEPNVIAVEVGEGWYAGRLGYGGGGSCFYGDRLGLLAQLEISTGGNSTDRIETNQSWQCQPSDITRSQIYDGEDYDGRLEHALWNREAGEGSGDWHAVEKLEAPSAELFARHAPPVRVVAEVKPVEMITTPSGKFILDFGENVVGKLQLRHLHKPSGHKITLKHAEVLENDELGIRPLRVAKCTDNVICSGDIMQWTPQFTFHGFRYAQIEGWTPRDQDCPLNLAEDISALVLQTDLTRLGHFSCSHKMVNQLHENAWRSMRGNFLSIPTDCPQRDERLGWTGDIQVFSPSANFLYKTAGMLGDWLKDLAAEQLEPGTQGIPPFVVPNVLQDLWPHMPQAIWDDVTVLLPWNLYRSYGDKDILQRQYPSMLAWLDQGISRGKDRLWDQDQWHLGDWLDPAAPPEEPGDARTNGALVADAYLVHVTTVMAEISSILGKEDEFRRFKQDAVDLKHTFQQKYVAPSGLLVGDTQTALALAIRFDLHEDEKQSIEAGARLAKLVRQAQFRVSTGFAGTPSILSISSSASSIPNASMFETRCSVVLPPMMGKT